ncbi:MAG: M16 family metallopeptidase [Nitrospirota bacterium]
MTRYSLAGLMIALIASAALAATGPSASTPVDPRAMAFPTEPFTPPKAERIRLSNGMIVYLLEDHELPLVSLSAMIRTGSMYDPADKVGLAELAGTVIRTGGSALRSGDELDDALEFVGAEMSSWAGLDSAGASLNVLTKDLPSGLEMFAEMLMRPAFAPEKVDLAKNQMIEAVRRRNDHPGSIAAREFRKLLYGADHPYGRESTEATIRAVTREDLTAFHRRYYHPNNIMLAVTGDIRRDDLLALLRRGFQAWPRAAVTWPSVPPVGEPRNAPVNFISRDVTQTQVRMGWLSIKQSDPDFFALSLLDDIVGGQAFTSRLFQEVRTKAGLAYSVGSALNAGRFDRGSFVLFAQTKAESTTRAIEAIRAEINRVASEPVSERELADAKQAFVNSFVFSFSSPAQITNRQMSLEYYGLPADFLDRFRANVENVTARDLLRVAKRHLDPGRLVVLAVGDDQRFDKPLATVGRVRTLTVSEPGGPSPSPGATDAQ